MAGMAGGFAQGYADTALKLQQLQQTKDQEDQRLEVQKENLALQRDVLKGQESSRKLQDLVHLETLTRLQREYQASGAAKEALKNLAGGTQPPAEADPAVHTGPAPALDGSTQTIPGAGGAITETVTRPPAPGITVTPPTGATPQVGLYQRIVAQQGQNLGLDPDVVRTFQAMLPVENASGDPTATSPKGALGPAQLMPATAARYQVDPANPVQNLSGGLRYFNDLWQMFPGHPEYAIAAYNAGEGAVKQAGGIPNFPETQAYVKKVLGNLPAQATPDLSQQMAGPGAPTPASPPTASSASAPASPPQGERLSDEAIQVALASNPQRRELGQVTQELQRLDASRTQLQTIAAKSGLTDQATYKEKIAELDKAIAQQTARRTQLEDRLQPKTPYDQWTLSTYGGLPIDLQQIPGKEAEAQAAYERQSITTKERAKDDFERTQPVLKVDPKHDYVDLATGQKVPATMTYGQALDLVAQGKVKAYEPLDAGRGKTYTFATRAQQAQSIITPLEADGETGQRWAPYLAKQLDIAGGVVLGAAGGFFGAAGGPLGAAAAGAGGAYGGAKLGEAVADPLARVLRTPQEQQYFNAKMTFLMAVLRRDTGAVMSPSEFRQYDDIYFPQPGEGPEAIRQKAALRAQEVKSMETEVGRPLGTPISVPLAPKPTPAAPAAPAAPIPPEAAAPQGA